MYEHDSMVTDVDDLHSVPSWPVAVVFSSIQIGAAVVLELLFKWKSVELATQSELAVDFLLADVEVLHVKEAFKRS